MSEETNESVSDPTEQALENAAAQLDEQGGEGEVDVELPSAKEPVTRAAGTEQRKTPDGRVTEPGVKPESSATNADNKRTEQTPKGERARDLKSGRFAKAGEKEPPATGEPERPETAYSRAGKEEERYQRNWQKLNEDQARFRQEVQAFEQQRMELAASMEGRHPTRATKEGFTADEYEEAAEDFAKEGNRAMAFEAMKAAREIREFEAQAQAEIQQAQVQHAFAAGMEATINERPELGDPNSPIARQVMDILGQYGWLYYVDNGFRIAADVAQLRLEAAMVPELRKKLEQTEANLTSTSSKLQPARGRASVVQGAKSFREMAPEEQEKYLEAKAEELDAQGVL
jgi:protein tyrosine phosphatase (PTP) superfamily phosphohydrolase (DUF442 family)